jgi:hypothetical protein
MRAAVLALTGLLAATSAAHADPAVPLQVPVTVRIARDGAPVNETLPLTFAIFTQPSAGNSLWNGVAHDVVVRDGIASDTLGLEANNPLDPDDFDGRVLYLQVVVGNYQMPDRIALRSVPYALRAGTAGLADQAKAADRATRADGAALAESLGLPTTPAALRTTIDAAGNLKVAGTLTATPTFGVSNMGGVFELNRNEWTVVKDGTREIEAVVTTHGKPVMISVNANFIPLQAPSDWKSEGSITVFRVTGTERVNLGDGTFGLQTASDNVTFNHRDPMSFTYMDVPPAGTHTYELHYRSHNNVRTALTGPTQIAVHELN